MVTPGDEGRCNYSERCCRSCLLFILTVFQKCLFPVLVQKTQKTVRHSHPLLVPVAVIKALSVGPGLGRGGGGCVGVVGKALVVWSGRSCRTGEDAGSGLGFAVSLVRRRFPSNAEYSGGEEPSFGWEHASESNCNTQPNALMTKIN